MDTSSSPAGELSRAAKEGKSMMSSVLNVQWSEAPERSSARARKTPAVPVRDRFNRAIDSRENVLFSGHQGPAGEEARSTVTTPFENVFVTTRVPVVVRVVSWRSPE